MRTYVVWCPDLGQEQEDGATIPATDPADAAEGWAEWHDRSSAEYRIAAMAAEIERLRTALASIEEYWNRDQNETAMTNACWHTVETAREALAAAPKPHWPVPSAPAVPQWQPIETAPKLAGGRVLILKDCGPGTLSSMSIAFWLDDDRWHLTESTGTAESYGYRVTHWMPLPAAPSPTEKKESRDGNV